ncbi:MAG: transposase [Desulfobacterales bacterium PC51MH44]|nr:MAG: transposase [Desulfobacterales bacterium PC51MH44]
MPRKSRIDAPGALHHVIARGIERRKIFKDNQDRDDFLNRLGNIITQTGTICYAWSLMPNHFHLLLKTGNVPIATVMRRLLTGYAIRFNLRYHRSGHLFQNRYKSILCQEDAYLKELVRYIHLNPLRANVVKDLKILDRYRYCGHSTILGKYKAEWQSSDFILLLFDTRISKARRLYRKFVEQGIKLGKQPDLIGGGLVRSAGGWTAVRSLAKAGIYFKSDERILGDSDFVENVLAEAQEALEHKYALAAQGVDLEHLIQITADLLSIDPKIIFGSWKTRNAVKARSLICFWGVSELGLTLTYIAKILGISLPTASVAKRRGERIVFENQYSLLELLNINI